MFRYTRTVINDMYVHQDKNSGLNGFVLDESARFIFEDRRNVNDRSAAFYSARKNKRRTS